MIVVRGKDVEVSDAGKRSGLPPMAFTRKWLIHKKVGDDSYGHRFAVREFKLEPGVRVTMHHHPYVEAVYIVRGKLLFENCDKEKAEVGAGDVVYTHEWEPHALSVVGDDRVVIVCCIDCINGGDNCDPSSSVGAPQSVEC